VAKERHNDDILLSDAESTRPGSLRVQPTATHGLEGAPEHARLVLVGCDGDSYGRIVVYSFSKGTLVYGPPQVESVIEQDPKISRQLTLWNQQGSSATRGRMVILPIDGVVTYLQGVFLESATAAKIPELVRFIVSEGEFAAMEPSLPEAFAALNEEISARASKERSVRGQPIVPPKQAPSAGATPGAN